MPAEAEALLSLPLGWLAYSTKRPSKSDSLQEQIDAYDRGEPDDPETLPQATLESSRTGSKPSQPAEASQPSIPESKAYTLQELVEEANRGDKASLNVLRQFLEQHPEVWTKAGDLAAHAEASWIRLVTGGNSLAAEGVRRQAERLRAELLGGSATPIERLLVDQVVSCWLQLKHAEIAAGSNGKSSLTRERFHDQRLERVQRRYFGALKALSQIRKVPVSSLGPAAGRTTLMLVAGENSDATLSANATAPVPEESESESSSAEEGARIRLFPTGENREAV
jgi:hypothetical protein